MVNNIRLIRFKSPKQKEFRCYLVGALLAWLVYCLLGWCIACLVGALLG